jgi:hypothetical protein
MSDVVVQVLDKDKTVLYTYNSVCYAGMRKWGNTIEYPTAQYLAWKGGRHPVSPEYAGLWECFKGMWEFPPLTKGMAESDLNTPDGKVAFDIDQFSSPDIFAHFCTLRYLAGEHANFGARFNELQKRFPTLPPHHIFVMTNWFGGTHLYGNGHSNYFHTLPIGPLEDLTPDDLRKYWPKDAKPHRATSSDKLAGYYAPTTPFKEALVPLMAQAKFTTVECSGVDYDVVHYFPWNAANHMPMILRTEKRISTKQFGTRRVTDVVLKFLYPDSYEKLHQNAEVDKPQ